MAGLAANAALAVTVLVTNPGDAPQQRVWEAPTATTIAQIATQWSREAGYPAPLIAGSFANYRVDGLTLVAGDYCAALGRLVASMKHSAAQPRVVQCGSTQAAVVQSID